MNAIDNRSVLEIVLDALRMVERRATEQESAGHYTVELNPSEVEAVRMALAKAGCTTHETD